jgi:hypothetical protein
LIAEITYPFPVASTVSPKLQAQVWAFRRSNNQASRRDPSGQYVVAPEADEMKHFRRDDWRPRSQISNPQNRTGHLQLVRSIEISPCQQLSELLKEISLDDGDKQSLNCRADQQATQLFCRLGELLFPTSQGPS